MSVEHQRALMWVYDLLTVDRGLRLDEQLSTARQIAKVLTGQKTRAAEYVPNEWDESAKLMASVFPLKCKCCQRTFKDGETCSMGGCPMGGDF